MVINNGLLSGPLLAQLLKNQGAGVHQMLPNNMMGQSEQGEGNPFMGGLLPMMAKGSGSDLMGGFGGLLPMMAKGSSSDLMGGMGSGALPMLFKAFGGK